MAFDSCLSALKTLTVLFILATACLFVPDETSAAQLTASWVDQSEGRATTRLERRVATTTSFVAIADVPAGQSTHLDTTVSAGTTYCYRAHAYTAGAVSPYTGEVCATTTLDGHELRLSVSKAGSGAGSVVSAPGGINCGTVCSGAYLAGTAVTLTAAPASGSTFTGWSGGGCSGTAPCTISGNGSVAVTATFAAASVAPSTPSTAPSSSLSLVTSGDPATGPYAVEARTSTTSGVAVKFYVDGAFHREERVAKFCLFAGGDGGTPCNTGRLGGTAPRVVKAQLIASATGAVLAEAQLTISEGTSSPLTLAVTGDPKIGPFSIEARTTRTGVVVRFEVDGALYRTESTAKFCLFGGGDGAAGACRTGTLSAGTHVVKAKLVSTTTGAVLGEAQTSVSR